MPVTRTMPGTQQVPKLYLLGAWIKEHININVYIYINKITYKWKELFKLYDVGLYTQGKK